MTKFKIGDMVTGILGSSNRYLLTNENYMMEVIKINGKFIDVKIITCYNKCGTFPHIINMITGIATTIDEAKGKIARDLDSKWFRKLSKLEYRKIMLGLI